MKRFNIILALIFSVLYGVVVSLGIECLLSLMGFTFTISGIDAEVTNKYPIFIPFCIAMGILAVVLLIVIFIFNLKAAEKFSFKKYLWWIEMAAACVMAYLTVKPWEDLFVFLRDRF